MRIDDRSPYRPKMCDIFNLIDKGTLTRSQMLRKALLFAKQRARIKGKRIKGVKLIKTREEYDGAQFRYFFGAWPVNLYADKLP